MNRGSRWKTRVSIQCPGGGRDLPKIASSAKSARCPVCKNEVPLEWPTPEATAAGYYPKLARHHRGKAVPRGPASRSTRKK